MPIIKSAVKRVKQAEKHRERNIQFKRDLKNNTRALDAAIEARSSKNIDKLLASVYSSYDIAVKKNIIHKNKAARKKAHYSSAVKQISAKKTKPSTDKKGSKKAPVKK